MLNELRRFETEIYNGRDYSRHGVDRIAISDLGYPMKQWVNAYFSTSHTPLMASFALDTASFVMAHVNGYHASSEEGVWQIQAVLDGKKELRDFADAQFKREFTMSLGRPVVVADVPKDGHINMHNGASILGPGAKFLFSVERCHLSSGVYDHASFYPHRKQKPKYDLSEDFKFYGSIWMLRDADRFECVDVSHILEKTRDGIRDLNQRFLYGGLRMELPVEWITHTVDLSINVVADWQTKPSLVPVPVWNAELL
jgi:hypothetical protein